jgi:hypothetical protein
MYDATAIGTDVVKELATYTYFNPPLQHQYLLTMPLLAF